MRLVFMESNAVVLFKMAQSKIHHQFLFICTKSYQNNVLKTNQKINGGGGGVGSKTNKNQSMK